MIWTTPLIHLGEKQVKLEDLKEGDVLTLRHKDGGGAMNPFKPLEYQEFIYHADGTLTSIRGSKDED